MTFVELTDQVRIYTRINGNDLNLMALVKDAINVAIYDVARENKINELLTIDTPVDLTGIVAAEGKVVFNISTPSILTLDRVRFIDGFSGRSWILPLRSGMVPPAPIYGKPRAHEFLLSEVDPLVANKPTLKLEPYLSIDEDVDSLSIDYYRVPSKLLYDDDSALSARWDSEIVKRASHYMLIYLNKLEEANVLWKSILGVMPEKEQQ